MASKFLDSPLGAQIDVRNDLFLVDSLSRRKLSFTETFSLADDLSNQLPDGLLVLLIKNQILFALTYLGALRNKQTVLILDPGISSESLNKILSAFQPQGIVSDSFKNPDDWVTTHLPEGGQFFSNPNVIHSQIGPELAVLMPTSGSTGSPKCVRVSLENIQSSAAAIGSYLNLQGGRKFITSLPFHYTYGLSLLHLSLAFRLPIILTDQSALTNDFWETYIQYGATDFSGVPSQYEFLVRRGLDPKALLQTQCMTQAGGRLDPAITIKFLDLADEFHFNFFTMYGQTEATPRIAYVPKEFARAKLGSAGLAIPGGKLSIAGHGNDVPVGEIIYEGKNVSLGYAFDWRDLSKNDEFQGVLKTGDFGYLDTDGFLFVQGRIAREIKVSGVRINLDEIEAAVRSLDPSSVVVGSVDQIVVVVSMAETREVQALVSKQMSVHPSKVRVELVQEIPYLSNGKINYQLLGERFLKI